MRPFMRGAWWLPFIFSEGGINASVTGAPVSASVSVSVLPLLPGAAVGMFSAPASKTGCF